MTPAQRRKSLAVFVLNVAGVLDSDKEGGDAVRVSGGGGGK